MKDHMTAHPPAPREEQARPLRPDIVGCERPWPHLHSPAAMCDANPACPAPLVPGPGDTKPCPKCGLRGIPGMPVVEAHCPDHIYVPSPVPAPVGAEGNEKRGQELLPPDWRESLALALADAAALNLPYGFPREEAARRFVGIIKQWEASR